MVISLKELARAPQQTICFDYNMDLSKEELNFEFPFKEPVKIIGEIEERLDAVALTADIEAMVTTRCARCNNHSSCLSALRAHVEDIIDTFENVQVVFYYYNGISLLNKLLQHSQQNLDVVEMKTCSRFIQNIKSISSAFSGEFCRKLHSLTLST